MEERENLPIVALIYDFDGTLSPGNMQEYSFIGAVGMEKEEFWAETAVMAENQDSDNVLVYMLLMLEKAKQTGKPIREESFREFGKSVELFKGKCLWCDYSGWRQSASSGRHPCLCVAYAGIRKYRFGCPFL